MPPDGFRLYLDRAAKHLGSQVALARALGIDPTRVSRLMRGDGDYAHLNFENCLRLAAILDEWPVEILRAAGHTEQARLLERLCGPPDERSVRSSEWKLLQMWRELPREKQSAVLTLLESQGEPAAQTATVRREFPRHAGRRGGS